MSAPDVVVRTASQDDLPAIVDLWWELSVFADALSPMQSLKGEAECKASARENHERSFPWAHYHYIVAECAGEIVGYMIANLAVPPQKSRFTRRVTIQNAFVKERFRRQGICRRMYERLEEYARQNRADYIEVTTESLNLVARAAYRSFGLVEAKVELCKPLRPAGTGLGAPKPIRIGSIDPYDWGAVLNASRAEGHNLVDRLLADYRAGTNRFDAPGEALFAHLLGSCVVAVGGLNREPDPSFPRAGRVRRLYVLPNLRGQGFGRTLVEEIMAAANGRFVMLTVNVGQLPPRGFYEHLGFKPVDHPGITHTRQVKDTR